MCAPAELRRSGPAGRVLAPWPAHAGGRPARARPTYRTAGDARHCRVRPGHASGAPRRGDAATLVLPTGGAAAHRRGAATRGLETPVAPSAGQRPGAVGISVGDHGALRRRGAGRARSVAEPAGRHRRLVVAACRPDSVAARAGRGIAAVRRAVRGARRGVAAAAHLGAPGWHLYRRPSARARRPLDGLGGRSTLRRAWCTAPRRFRLDQRVPLLRGPRWCRPGADRALDRMATRPARRGTPRDAHHCVRPRARDVRRPPSCRQPAAVAVAGLPRLRRQPRGEDRLAAPRQRRDRHPRQPRPRGQGLHLARPHGAARRVAHGIRHPLDRHRAAGRRDWGRAGAGAGGRAGCARIAPLPAAPDHARPVADVRRRHLSADPPGRAHGAAVPRLRRCVLRLRCIRFVGASRITARTRHQHPDAGVARGQR